MKHFKLSLLSVLAALVLSTGCSKKFEDYSINKNLPVQVPPSLILPTILNDLVTQPGNSPDQYSQYIVSNYNYYGDNKYWTGSTSLNFGTLKNVTAMEAEAKRITGTDVNPYRALGLFFRAFFFVNMTEAVGDLPMTDALKGLGNTAPKYDTQKQIFKQSLAWLDTANTMLASFIQNGFLEFSGDFYYKERINNPVAGSNGREALIKWQKVVNSYKLRVLIELSKKAGDADLSIPAQFAAIFSNPVTYPIFTSNDDNLQYVFNSTFNYYPDNPSNYGNNAGRLNIAATLETNLGKFNDIRAMIFGEPARGLGFSDTSYNSFVGGRSGDDVSTLATLSGAKSICLYNYNHYYKTFTAEPTLILSYGETCYDIAEALNRGWITGDASAWYQNGTKAMFAFYGVTDGLNQVVFRNAAGTGDATYNMPFSFNAYFNQPLVKYMGNNANGLNQILTEKYFAYARNSGLQGYYQWRRTGIPAFSAGTGTGNGGIIPLRFQYPSNEKVANATNYIDAVQKQYNGSDDINAKMWLIQ